MASSGRVPPAIRDMMASTITISAATTTDRYGDQSYGAGRSVTCMVQPSGRVMRRVDGTMITISFELYCDDVDIDESDQVTLADGNKVLIDTVSTYADEVGPMYQVVSVT